MLKRTAAARKQTIRRNGLSDHEMRRKAASTPVNAIEIRGLTKSFGKKCAVNGLNMTVPIGSIYGFIGENGSGKSTTEKMICGLIHSDKGSIRLFGRDYTDPDVRAKIGV